MRDVAPAARPRGTTLTVRDLFFSVPARRKFLRSEATESFHLANLVTHYALAHPEISFALSNQGREVLRASPAADLRERAYQIFGAEFLENLLEVGGGRAGVARVRGYVSAPRERRTTRDAQYLFVNGRYVRDRLVGRALLEAYRSVLPHGVYPAALLFLEVPPEEVDVNVHPAKTEVRFRRAAAVADSVRDSVRAALAAAGFLRLADPTDEPPEDLRAAAAESFRAYSPHPADDLSSAPPSSFDTDAGRGRQPAPWAAGEDERRASPPRQESIEFGRTPTSAGEAPWPDDKPAGPSNTSPPSDTSPPAPSESALGAVARHARDASSETPSSKVAAGALPPLDSAAGIVREASPESVSPNIRPVGQLDESFIIATDPEGLLLIDQHAAHERILFDKYRRLESERRADSQAMLVPETFDLTPAQAAAFGQVSADLEHYGFELMRLSGRTVAIRAVPVDLPAGEARNLLAEILDTVDAERRGRARANLRDEIAASLACRAAIKINTPLTTEKMRWLIDRLLATSSPTTCPHGRPIILRLTKRDIERGFHRP